jgi:hypothetical protein
MKYSAQSSIRMGLHLRSHHHKLSSIGDLRAFLLTQCFFFLQVVEALQPLLLLSSRSRRLMYVVERFHRSGCVSHRLVLHLVGNEKDLVEV